MNVLTQNLAAPGIAEPSFNPEAASGMGSAANAAAPFSPGLRSDIITQPAPPWLTLGPGSGENTETPFNPIAAIVGLLQQFMQMLGSFFGGGSFVNPYMPQPIPTPQPPVELPRYQVDSELGAVSSFGKSERMEF